MELNDFKIALEEVKKVSPKRNFKQSYDIIINLRDYDIKRTENHVDFFATLHYPRGKPVKICGFVGPELKDQSKKSFDKTIITEEFATLGSNKKEVKKLAVSYDYFVAQGNIMAQVAKAFGRVFGPKQKMPNPKAGCVVPANANLDAVKQKLEKTVRLSAKTEKCIKCRVGIEGQDEKEILDNLLTVYNQAIHHLPNEENNVQSVLIKLTMGKCVFVGKKGDKKQSTEKKPVAVEEKKEEAQEEKSAPAKETKKSTEVKEKKPPAEKKEKKPAEEKPVEEKKE